MTIQTLNPAPRPAYKHRHQQHPQTLTHCRPHQTRPPAAALLSHCNIPQRTKLDCIPVGL